MEPRVPESGGTRFPDDPVVPDAPDVPYAVPHGGLLVKDGPRHGDVPQNSADPSRRASRSRKRRFRDFALFRATHRPLVELQNLSISSVRALLGAREEHFSGMLTIREDLPSQWYLEVPFLRRCWRLVWILDEYEQGDHAGEPLLTRTDQGFSFSRDLLKDLDMSPESARINMLVLIRFLVEAGMLQLRRTGFLSDRARALVAAGSPGAFYKSLCIRTFNRCSWGRDDNLPPFHSIQLNGLFLLFVMHSRCRGESGRRDTSALVLAEKICALNSLLGIAPGPDVWIRDQQGMASVIHFRLLARIGRILGLVEQVPDLAGQLPGPEDTPYRPTLFMERVLLWNP